MQELLVIFACLHGSGCSQSSDAYAHYNPEIVEHLKSMQDRYVNPLVLNRVLPLLVAAQRKEIELNVIKNTSVKIDSSYKVMIQLSKTF